MSKTIRALAIAAVFAGMALVPLATSAAAAEQPAGSVTVQDDSGLHRCGVVRYEVCYAQRADFIRHGYGVSDIYWLDGMGYIFQYWSK